MKQDINQIEREQFSSSGVALPIQIGIQKGFTLIELMVTVAIAAILVTLAVPAYDDMVNNNRLTAAANELLGTMYLARSEAVRENKEVNVCTSRTTDLSLDNIVCDNGASWHEGWIVWSDTDEDGTLDAAEIIRIGNGLEGTVEVFSSVDVASSVTFNKLGMIDGGDSGTWQICDRRGTAYATALVLNPSGRVKTSETDHLGGGLTCS